MARGGLPALAGLELGDPAELWQALGFHVGPGGELRIGGVLVALDPAAGRGLHGWTLRAEQPLAATIDGIPTRTTDGDSASAGPTHPNGALGLDHVVVATPAIGRTLAALEACGMELRATRRGGTADHPVEQAFVWAGEVLLELVSRPSEQDDEGPASLWGLVVVCPSLAGLAELSGGRIGPARDAVQPGRQIATLSGAAGSTTAVAFMTPHVR